MSAVEHCAGCQGHNYYPEHRSSREPKPIHCDCTWDPSHIGWLGKWYGSPGRKAAGTEHRRRIRRARCPYKVLEGWVDMAWEVQLSHTKEQRPRSKRDGDIRETQASYEEACLWQYCAGWTETEKEWEGTVRLQPVTRAEIKVRLWEKSKLGLCGGETIRAELWDQAGVAGSATCSEVI